MTYSPGALAASTAMRAFAASTVSAVSSHRSLPSFSTLNTSSGEIIHLLLTVFGAGLISQLLTIFQFERRHYQALSPTLPPRRSAQTQSPPERSRHIQQCKPNPIKPRNRLALRHYILLFIVFPQSARAHH